MAISWSYYSLLLLTLLLSPLPPSSATTSKSSQFPFPGLTPSIFTPCTSALVQMVQGKYPNGALIMNAMGKAMNDLGNYDDCLTLNNSRYCLLHGSLPQKTGPNLGYVIGWCVPLVCDEQGLLDTFSSLQTNISEKLGMSIAVKVSLVLGGTVEQTVGTYHLSSPLKLLELEPVCKPNNSETGPGVVIMLLVLSIFLLLVIAGSIMDYMLTVDPAPTLIIHTSINTSPPQKEQQEENDDDSTVALTDGHQLEVEDFQKKALLDRQQFGVKLLLCFSIIRNLKSLLFSERNKETSFLHGIRVFCMLYIVLGHTNTFLSAAPIMDMIQLFTVIFKRFTFQFIIGGFFAVDAFYFLSGFLGCVMLLDILFRKEKVNWALVYFHRWWRLTPLYFVIIWVWSYLAPKMIEGPITYATHSEGFIRDDGACEKYWWSNILYLNNFIPWENNLKHQCMAWSWYLANDMQLFVITPLLLGAYKKNKKMGLAIMFVLLTIAYVVVGVTIKQEDCKIFSDEWFNLYTKPWTRIGPYMIGVGLALMWKEKKIVKVSLVFKGFIYVIAYLLIVTTIFGPYTNRDETWTVAERILYYTFSRTGFVLGLALFSYLMLSEESSFLKTFLSLYIWTPLARLTYGAYLVHPILMVTSAASSRHALNWDIWTITLNFSSYALLAYSASLIFWLLVEKPFMSLEKEVLGRLMKKKEDI